MEDLTLGLTTDELLIHNPVEERRARLSRAVRFTTCALGFGVLASLATFGGHLGSQGGSASEAILEHVIVAGTELNLETFSSQEKLSRDYRVRVAHAKELLGKYYGVSVVRHGERARELSDFVRDQLNQRLKGEWNRDVERVHDAILEQSRKHGFDPLFLMAVIENESSFRVTVRGGVGEIGLMQIKPDTAKWIARKFDLPWNGEKTLLDPVGNIRIGSAYLSYLRERFDSHGRLYLAAYNMGSRNVKRALGKKIWPKDYPSAVMDRYIRLYTELKRDSAGEAEIRNT